MTLFIIELISICSHKLGTSFPAERKKESYKSYSAFVLIGRKKMPNARVSTSKCLENLAIILFIIKIITLLNNK